MVTLKRYMSTFLITYSLTIHPSFSSEESIEIDNTFVPSLVKKGEIVEYELPENISDFFSERVAQYNFDPYEEYMQCKVKAAKDLNEIFPSSLIEIIQNMKSGGGPKILLIRNFPIDIYVPPTPVNGNRPAPSDKGFVSESGILGLCDLLGAYPYFDKEEKDGTCINQIIPIKGSNYLRQASSFGSDVEFLFHTENVYQEPPLKFLTLLCLRGDPKVKTTFIHYTDIIDYITLKDPSKSRFIQESMLKDDFIMSSGPSFESTTIEKRLPILSYENGEVVFRLNLNPGRVRGTTQEAQETLSYLHRIITSEEFKEKYSYSFTLCKGNLILINNWEIMHGRDSFTIDSENWRWLQRCYFMTSTK